MLNIQRGLLTGLLFPYPLPPTLFFWSLYTLVCELAYQVQRPQAVERQGQSIAWLLRVVPGEITNKRHTWMDQCRPESSAIQANTVYNALRVRL